MRLKTDSFVVEPDTHFPTDYNLLWDCCRKCIDLSVKFEAPGWRKSKDWYRVIKGFMRKAGKISACGGANQAERLNEAVTDYLRKAGALERKISEILNGYPSIEPWQMAVLFELDYYHQMLIKHIDLVDRRLLKGETIPHQEKVFSVFQPYTEFIKKGHLRPNVEIGKKLVVTTDQYDLLADWQLAENQTDNQLSIPLADRLLNQYSIASMSFDKGFSDKEDKAILELYIHEVIMPEKGKRSQQEKAVEQAPAFRKLKNKHSAVESNINELEHRGMDRCPNRNWTTFTPYVGLAATAYNLHKIGRNILKERLEEEKQISRHAA